MQGFLLLIASLCLVLKDKLMVRSGPIQNLLSCLCFSLSLNQSVILREPVFIKQSENLRFNSNGCEEKLENMNYKGSNVKREREARIHFQIS